MQTDVADKSGLSLDWESPGSTASEFLKDTDSFVRGLRGPVGSGKSVTCCIDIFIKACAQKPNKKKIRSTRWAIVRNTNPELKTTTIKTWREWFDDEWGKFTWSPPYTHMMKFAHPDGDGTTVEAEVIFLALDRDDQIKKLLSLELTGAWINEAREIPKNIVDAVTMRVGRYPSKRTGGPTWSGVILDTNSPSENHWWPIMSGEVPAPDYLSEDEKTNLVKPKNWKFYTQPAAMVEEVSETGAVSGYRMSSRRENAKNLPAAYYENLIGGKDRTWIWVYVLNRYQTLKSGKPVYTGFRSEVHVAKEPLLPFKGAPVYVGIDFGRNPTAIFAQPLHNTRWQVFAELLGPDMSTTSFAKLLRHALNTLNLTREDDTGEGKPKPMFPLYFIGDPAGDNRPEADDVTSFMIMNAAGIPVVAANTNDPQIRIEAVQGLLDRLVEGKPALLISPTCTNLISGLEGGYQYRKIKSSLGDIYDDKPNKDRYSHPQDALQYAVIGGGEGARLIGGDSDFRSAKHAVAGDFDPLRREKRRAHRARVQRGGSKGRNFRGGF
jgi:hypothetical protein